MRRDLDKIFDERVCPECGKHFFKPVESIYKITQSGKLQYFCSYTCWVAALKRMNKW